MKKLLTLGTVLALTAPLARAWTYQDGDVLLIFRESGFNDVEFDLGNVSRFLNQPTGITVPVTGWDSSLVFNTFGNDLTGVSVLVAGTSSVTAATRAAWLTTGDPSAVAYDVTGSGWQANLWSTINAIGTRPIIYNTPVAGTAGYSIDPNGSYRITSYDYIVSGGGVNASAIPEFGGNAGFQVELVAPGTLGFWEITPSTVIPKPAASYIGTFAIDAGGNLTFTAGPAQAQAQPPTILGITRTGGVDTISFTTVSGGNYSLVYTNTLGAAVSTWPVVGASVPGDGGNHSLSHTNPDNGGFYGVVRTP